MRLSDNLQRIGVFLLILIALKFFEARFLGDFIGIKFPFLVLLTLNLLGLVFFFKFNSKFSLPIQLLTFSSLFSIVIAFLFWGQSIPDSLTKTIPIAIFPIFFLLKKLNISIKIIEQVIILLGIFYIGLYTFQYFNPNKAYFGYALVNEFGEFEESRGVIRIVFPGAGIFWLAVFISISKITQKMRPEHLFFALAGLVIPVMQALRQIMVMVVLLYSFHFGKYLELWKKTILAILVGGGFIMFFSSDLKIVEGLKETIDKDKSEGTKYVRFITAEYYFTEFSDNLATIVFGNGVPNEKSEYGQKTIRLQEREIWLEDVGLAGIYSQFGILSILAWLIIAFQSLKLKVPKNYLYCKYYLWLVLLTSLTSGGIYNIHYAISTVLVLYIFDSITDEKYLRIKKILSTHLRTMQNQLRQKEIK